MKFFHLSDLHLGMRLNEYSLIEDQAYILNQIISLIDLENPDAIIIAGDVYDKSLPSAQAVELFDRFLCAAAKRRIKIFIISGNHDSAERLSFASRLMTGSGVYIAPAYNGEPYCITLEDKAGELNVYTLPFVKPANVRALFPDAKIENYTDAVKVAVDNMKVDFSKRNILISHQFVTNANKSGSEELTVGGADNADLSAFGAFDYIALGHIHGAQNLDGGRARYCGTPLKYSFSEANQDKSVTVVEIRDKGDLSISTLPLKPMRDLVELKGTYLQLTDKSFYENTSYRNDYVHITLTDEDEILYAAALLRTIYKNLMRLDYDNARTRKKGEIEFVEGEEVRSPSQLFGDFYQMRNNKPMNESQQEFVAKIIDGVWEEK